MNSFEEVWNNICEHLQQNISSTAFDLWIRPLSFIQFEDDTVYLSIAEPFKRNIIKTKFYDKLADAGEEVFGFPVNFDILLTGEAPEKKETENKEEKTLKIKETYTFENFIKGPSNSFAYSAAINVASNPGKSYNPLFIYGPSGVGKTHLMNAIMNKIKKDNPGVQLVYFTGEGFMNEFIACIRNETNYVFRERYRNVDVLLIDDIQYIAGKTQTQDEFFHTFNTLKNEGKQIILTCDTAPRLLKGLPDRLISRFEEGILADISAPELETRIAIVKKKGEELGIELSDEICLYIAENVKKNIRQLEGIVNRCYAYRDCNNENITLSLVKSFINDISSEKMPIEDRVESIIQEITRVYNITADEIKSDKRSAPVVLARQVAMYVTSKLTSLTQKEIGFHLGGKDHATVIYAINSIEKKMEEDFTVKSTVDEIINNLNT